MRWLLQKFCRHNWYSVTVAPEYNDLPTRKYSWKCAKCGLLVENCLNPEQESVLTEMGFVVLL